MLPLRILGLLMLAFLLCDADSTCSNEFNPLTVDPPEVIVEYREYLLLNCSSQEEEYDEMYWRLGNITSDGEYLKSFLSWNVSLSDWNVMPECIMQLSESCEYRKDVKITMFKNPDAVYMFPIKHGNMVEGTPLEVQCDILSVAPVQHLTVTWYKNDEVIMIDSFNNTIKTPVDQSSTLIFNIGRREDGAQFRCEAQLNVGTQHPVTSESRKFPVLYAPELKNNTDVEVSVNEGNDVTLNCEAEGNPPPRFEWTRDGVTISEKTANLNINGVTTSATYICTASNDLGNITKQIHVRVIKSNMRAAPTAMPTPEASKKRSCPLILTPPEIVVRFGDPVSVNCSTSATDALGMGWEAAAGGVENTNAPEVTWAVEKLDTWDIKPQCFINLNDDTFPQCTMVPIITVYKTPDTVFVSALSHVMTEGTKHQLKCNIINVAPVQKFKVTWYQGNEIVHTDVFNKTSVTPVNKFSVWEFTPEREDNGAFFRCEAKLDLGPNGPELVSTVTSPPYEAVVHYKPQIPACPGHYSGVEHNFTIDMLPCKADGNPPPTVQWYYQGKLINAAEPLSRTQSGKYTAEFENGLGRSNTSVDITIEYGPLFDCDEHYEVNEGEKAICEPQGIPRPTITWIKDGKEKKSTQWTRHDSGQYLLRATNKHGTANHTLHVNVSYVTFLKTGNDTQEVHPGGNVTFKCSAEGNPSPKIYWEHPPEANVHTTGGHQKNITITGVTSTDAGVYICVAQNKAGTVKRFVTLVITGLADERSESPFNWWLIVVIALVVVVIILITIIYHNHSRKQGRYSFVPDTAKDGANVPMTALSNGKQA